MTEMLISRIRFDEWVKWLEDNPEMVRMINSVDTSITFGMRTNNDPGSNDLMALYQVNYKKDHWDNAIEIVDLTCDIRCRVED